MPRTDPAVSAARAELAWISTLRVNSRIFYRSEKNSWKATTVNDASRRNSLTLYDGKVIDLTNINAINELAREPSLGEIVFVYFIIFILFYWVNTSHQSGLSVWWRALVPYRLWRRRPLSPIPRPIPYRFAVGTNQGTPSRIFVWFVDG